MHRSKLSAEPARVIPPRDGRATGLNPARVVTIYLTIAEAAELVRVSPKRLRNLMANGTLREGTHYTRPAGLRPRFKREALLAWLEGSEGESSSSGDSARHPPKRARCRVDLTLVPRVQGWGDGL
jgi:excisionase family DNA binding protein